MPVLHISQEQKYCALSVTEASLIATVTVVQHMIYVMNLLNSFELKVELPMVIEIDNKDYVDLINNWLVSGRTRHIDVKKNYLRELKENGVIELRWSSGEENSSDLFTKNLGGPAFEKHSSKYISEI